MQEVRPRDIWASGLLRYVKELDSHGEEEEEEAAASEVDVDVLPPPCLDGIDSDQEQEALAAAEVESDALERHFEEEDQALLLRDSRREEQAEIDRAARAKRELFKPKSNLLNTVHAEFEKIMCEMEGEQRGSGSVTIDSFLNGCNFLYLVFEKIRPANKKAGSRALEIARGDMLGNIQRLRKKQREKREKFTRLAQAPMYDYLAILWLNRALEFISMLLSTIANRRQATLVECVRDAYRETLSRYHNKLMSKLADFVIAYGTPGKRYDFLIDVSEGTYVEEELAVINDSRNGGAAASAPINESEKVMIRLAEIGTILRTVVEGVNRHLMRHTRYGTEKERERSFLARRYLPREASSSVASPAAKDAAISRQQVAAAVPAPSGSEPEQPPEKDVAAPTWFDRLFVRDFGPTPDELWVDEEYSSSSSSENETSEEECPEASGASTPEKVEHKAAAEPAAREEASVKTETT